MAKTKNQVEFDLSLLSLEQLIEIHKDIETFLRYLESSKVDVESEEN